MIPKIIHYCWLSDDPIPSDLQLYMNSWQKYLPDYTLMKWDYKRFPRGKSQWVDQAFEHKKYAFAADYIRLYALYQYGGIYLDMDVEVKKTFDVFLQLHTMMCYENGHDALEVAAFGVEKGSKWVEQCLKYYENRQFVVNGELDMRTLPLIITEQLQKKGYRLENVNTIEQALKIASEDEIPVFPFDYFSPKSYATCNIETTENTYSIHHFKGSWKPWEQKLEEKFWDMLGMKRHAIMAHVDEWLRRIGIDR